MYLLDTHVYALIGDEGFQKLVAAFYRRIPNDDILGRMYHGVDLSEAEWRLREFLVGRFGGPTRYIEKRGHPRLRLRHAPFKIDQSARDRWMSLMTAAMEETQIPEPSRSMLMRFFEDSATFMINHASDQP